VTSGVSATMTSTSVSNNGLSPGEVGGVVGGVVVGLGFLMVCGWFIIYYRYKCRYKLLRVATKNSEENVAQEMAERASDGLGEPPTGVTINGYYGTSVTQGGRLSTETSVTLGGRLFTGST
jgi:hypothetical protein